MVRYHVTIRIIRIIRIVRIVRIKMLRGTESVLAVQSRTLYGIGTAIAP